MRHDNGTVQMTAIDRDRRQLANLKAKQQALAKRMKACKSKIRRLEKEREDQRRQFIGQCVEQLMGEYEWVDHAVRQLLDRHLIRDADRKLFDLEPIPKAETPMLVVCVSDAEQAAAIS